MQNRTSDLASSNECRVRGEGLTVRSWPERCLKPTAQVDPKATVWSAQSRPSGATKADTNRLPRSMTSGGNHQCLPDRSTPSRKTCGDSSDLMIADEVEEFVGRQRGRPVESLSKLTPEFNQAIQGWLIFDSFSDKFQVENVRHLDNGPDNALG